MSWANNQDCMWKRLWDSWILCASSGGWGNLIIIIIIQYLCDSSWRFPLFFAFRYQFLMIPCIFIWSFLRAGWPGSKGVAMASRAEALPAWAWPSFGLFIFLSLSSKHLCLTWLLQPVSFMVPIELVWGKLLPPTLSPSTQSLVLPTWGVYWRWDLTLNCHCDTNLPGGNRTQALLLDRC